MTPDDLDRALVGVATGRLDLPATAFDAPVAAYLGRFLPGGSLVLTGCLRHDAPGTVTLTGTGGAAPFVGMDVVLEIAVPASAIGRVTVTAVGRPGWSLADAFGLLADTRLAALSFDRPTLVLDSAVLAASPGEPAPDPAHAAMTFSGTWRPTAEMIVVESLFPGGSHRITGDLVMVDVDPDLSLPTPTAPCLTLHGPFGQDVDLGPFRLTAMSFTLLGLPKANYVTWDSEVLGLFVITCDLVIGNGPLAGRTVPVSARVGGWRDQVVLTADFSDLGSIGPADLARTIGLSSLDVPYGVDPGPQVSLQTVLVDVDLGTPTIRRITSTVRTDAEWALIDDRFVLEAIDLTVRLERPLPPPGRVFVTVSGLFGIGKDGTLELSVSPYTRELSGGLRKGDPPLSIREVFEHFTDDPADHLPDLRVTAFDIHARLPAAGSPFAFSGELELDGSWELAPQVVLTALGVRLTHEGQTTFTVTAVLTLGSVDLAVRAGYDPDPKRQWEFAGSTGAGQQIPIGQFADALAARHGLALPAPLAGLTLADLSVAASSGGADLVLGGTAQFPLDGVEVTLRLAIDTGARSCTGTVLLAVGAFRPEFTVHLDADPTATRFAAGYVHAASDPVPPLAELVGAVSPALATFVPDGVTLDPRALVLARSSTGAAATYLFGAELAATVDLAHLPVVGPHLTGDTVVGLDPLRVLATSAPLGAAEVRALNALLPDDLAGLPDRDLPAGFLLDGVLRLGPFEHPVTLPVNDPGASAAGAGQAGGHAGGGQAGTGAPSAGGTAWVDVKRSIGPVHLSRVGLAWRHEPGSRPRVALLVDATLSAGGLTLTLDGLAVEIPASAPLGPPSFGLAGLGLDYSGGGLEVGGAFLAGTVSYLGRSYPAYTGAAHLRTPTLSLGALGAYAQLPTGPSLFVYAFLDYPLGGPCFFFVRGLAAGFGYHRRLVVAAADDIPGFPLVAEALGHRRPAAELGEELRALEEYLPVSPGDYFLAVGVHFTSFEMVDSFVLVSATFGHRLELTVLGVSTLVLPAAEVAGPSVTPIARVQLALRASIVPQDGYLSLTAQLTRDSFLLSQDCHLTGGYGFAAWFAGDQAGDFVVTAGGYHPHFPVPAHYPAVPRLGFSWQVTPQLSIRGSAYYAITPHALMAGGSLSATWHDGALSASFDAAMDFLISWQPYHYSADVSVQVRAAYTFSFFGTHTISVHVGAELHLWGPDFAGRATIDLGIASCTVRFGDSTRDDVRPVGWPTFRDALLPAPDQVVTVSVRSTTHRTASPPGRKTSGAAGRDLGAVNPAGLMITVDSQVPATAASAGPDGARTALGIGTATTHVGVGPVEVARGEFTGDLLIRITCRGVDMEDRFEFTPVTKSVPFALWGGRLRPVPTDPVLLPDALTGYTIRPRPPLRPAVSPSLERSALAAGSPVYEQVGAVGLAPPIMIPARSAAPGHGPGREAARLHALATGMRDPAVAAARARIAAAVLPEAPVDVTGFDPDGFLEVPGVMRRG